jgi:hypothetical protein
VRNVTLQGQIAFLSIESVGVAQRSSTAINLNPYGINTINQIPLNLDTFALFWLNAGGLLLENLVQSPQEPEAQGLPAVSVINARAAAQN